MPAGQCCKSPPTPKFAFPYRPNILSNVKKFSFWIINSLVMLRPFLLIIVLSIMSMGFACGGPGGISGDSPTEAYKRLFAAVKSKDTEAIKKQLTIKTIELGAISAKR